jgi:ATP-dependent Clp protease ATP-binding subunit ClpA
MVCKITLTLDAAARDWLAAKGWYPAYGARPLKRVTGAICRTRWRR